MPSPLTLTSEVAVEIVGKSEEGGEEEEEE